MLKKINLILSFLLVVSCSAQIPTPRVQWVSEIQQYGQRNTGLWIIPLPRKATFDSLGNVYTLFSVGDSLRLTTGVYRKSDGVSCVLAKINKSNASVAWAYPFKSNDSNMSLTDKTALIAVSHTPATRLFSPSLPKAICCGLNREVASKNCAR